MGGIELIYSRSSILAFCYLYLLVNAQRKFVIMSIIFICQREMLNFILQWRLIKLTILDRVCLLVRYIVPDNIAVYLPLLLLLEECHVLPMDWYYFTITILHIFPLHDSSRLCLRHPPMHGQHMQDYVQFGLQNFYLKLLVENN